MVGSVSNLPGTVEERCARLSEHPARPGRGPSTRWIIARFTAGAAVFLLAQVGSLPRFTWGRDTLGCGDMWNSNSLVSWLLMTSGIDATRVSPPDGGWAPGWASGVAVAQYAASKEETPR